MNHQDTLSTNVSMQEPGHRYSISENSGSSKYALPADEIEKQRLNMQSQMISKVFNNKLIWAPVSLKSGDVILDSGTGSGHWLLAVAQDIPPSVQIRGIDIEPRMFPANYPPNTSFIVESITSLPADWTSSIALVHQRLLVIALQAQQWKAALKEMHRVLVPGGWIQLTEPNHTLDTPSDALRNHKAFKIRDELIFGRGVQLDIIDHLPVWLEEVGFVGLKVECLPWPVGAWAGEDGAMNARVVHEFFTAIKGPIMKEGGFGLTSPGEYDALVEEMMRLCNETPETYFSYYVHVAQKPHAVN